MINIQGPHISAWFTKANGMRASGPSARMAVRRQAHVLDLEEVIQHMRDNDTPVANIPPEAVLLMPFRISAFRIAMRKMSFYTGKQMNGQQNEQESNDWQRN